MIFTIYTSNFNKYDAAGQLIQHITQDSVLSKFVWGIHNRKLMGIKQHLGHWIAICCLDYRLLSLITGTDILLFTASLKFFSSLNTMISVLHRKQKPSIQIIYYT